MWRGEEQTAPSIPPKKEKIKATLGALCLYFITSHLDAVADFQQGTVKLDPAVFVQQEMGLDT